MVDEVPYDAGDARQVTRKRQAAKFERDTELAELRAILKTEGGRKFVWRVLEQCRLYAPVDTMVDEGKRRVGLFLLTEVIEAEPSAYITMMQEAKARK